MKKYFFPLILLLGLLSSIAWQPVWADTFVVKDIQIEGLQRVPASTLYTYLPIKKGQVLQSGQSGAIIKALYETGFFEHISLARDGNTLIIKVVERSTIGRLKISGNHVIPTDKLNTVMKGVDVAEGRIFNRAMLDKIRQSLLNQYYQLGRYNAHVDVTVVPMSRSRVQVNIDISEGLIAVIRQINIIGNHAFTTKQLERQLSISTPDLVTMVTGSDRFSQEKLEESLEKLHNFYLDRGYLRFEIVSSQVEITPNRKSVYITIVIREGAAYQVSGVDLQGDFVIPKTELMQLVTVRPGTTFSRQVVVDSNKAISDALGNKGFIFANVSVKTDINDAAKQVYLTFDIKPNKRVYVHHINFVNNTKTNDLALRRQLVQMESGVISNKNLERSKRNLKLLPYIKDAQMSVVPAEGTDDQVDVNYDVTEQSAAEANFSIGYSQLQHFLIGIGFNQKNFLGTGEILGINATRSRFQQNYSLNFTDPYYTIDGVSRTINLGVVKFNPANANLASGFSTNEYTASVVYGIPLFQEKDVVNTLNLGYGYQGTLINLGNPSNQPSIQVNDFIARHGRQFQQINLIAGLARDSRDKAIFPTRGTIQALGMDVYLPAANQAITYVTGDYSVKWYQPLIGGFIATARGELAYGNATTGPTNFPFFKNYYAGGIDSVRGYQGNSLGPKDSNGKSTGGNALVTGSVGIIIPLSLGSYMPEYVSDNLRATVFVDGGNVFNTFNNRQYGGSGSGPLRYSTGLEVDWLTPMGPVVDISLAKPLNVHVNQADRTWSDEEEIFQFSLGANFG